MIKYNFIIIYMILIKLFILLNSILFVYSKKIYNNIDYNTKRDVLIYASKLMDGFKSISYIDCCGFYPDNKTYNCYNRFCNKYENSNICRERIIDCTNNRYYNYLNNTIDDISQLIKYIDRNDDKIKIKIKEKIKTLDYLNIILYNNNFLEFIFNCNNSITISKYNLSIKKLIYFRETEIKNINKTIQIVPNINSIYIKATYLFI